MTTYGHAKCVHCGRPIVRVRDHLGYRWRHEHNGVGYCHNGVSKRATPPYPVGPPLDRK